VTGLFVLLVIGVIAGVALVAAGRLDRLEEPLPDRRPERDPATGQEGPVFDVVPRGYRMDEVDAVITSLRQENARLRAEGGSAPNQASRPPLA
jgi:hypothetical protein